MRPLTTLVTVLRARSLARRPWHRTLVAACEAPQRPRRATRSRVAVTRP
jgi:hypothetical protein